MTPLLLIAAGLVALVAAALTLRSYGLRYRVGRLLAATPTVTVGEARRLAETGEAAYIRITGRIDAEEPFEDADHRPLVLRRTRFVARSGRSWTPFEDSRETVPFEIHEGLDTIGVDTAARLIVAEGSGRYAPAHWTLHPVSIDPELLGTVAIWRQIP